MSLSTTIKSLQDIMRKDAGVDGDAQRIGQLGWLLFFKIYSDLELEAEIEDERYVSPIPKGLHWSDWADQDTLGKDAPTGEALIDLVENQLFPKLKNLDLDSMSGKTRERGALLRGVFEDAFNYMKNGTLLRQVINKLNADIDFNQSKTRHLFGDIYEQILRDLQSAGNAGEFYTPRAATQFAVQMIDPQLGEKILDPACGTGGFLTHAYAHVQEKVRTPDDLELLKQSIHGVEKKSLPHLLCVTNMMIHGIEVPRNIRHDNTLARPLRDYGKADQVDIILTNPPFGGMEEDGIESNFPTEFRTRDTADLFLVLVMELLKDGGRAAIVLPDGTLFGEGIKTRIKKKLLDECNLHTIVRLPNGVFAPYTGIKTNILFFTKGEPTKEVWFYEHPYPAGYKSYSKTKPMRIDEFSAEVTWWTERQESEQAWRVPVEDIVRSGYNLDVKNPNTRLADDEDPDELVSSYVSAASRAGEAAKSLKAALARSLGEAEELSDAWLRIDRNWDALFDHANGIDGMRQTILQLAVRGRLVRQLSADESPDVALARCDAAKARLAEEGRFRRQGPVDDAVEEPFALPTGWRWAKVDECFHVTGGIQKSSKRRPAGNSFPYLRVANVQRGRLDLSEIEEFELFTGELERYQLAAGDLLVVEGNGSESEIGRCALWAGEIDKCVHQNHLIRCRPLDAGLERFALLYLNSPAGTAVMKRLAVTTSGLYNLSVGKIRSIVMPLPPIEEQSRIVGRVDELAGLCDALENALSLRSAASASLAVRARRALVSN